MVQTIVILGGAVGGLHIAHTLLKKNNKDVKVILVSKVCGGLLFQAISTSFTCFPTVGKIPPKLTFGATLN